MSKITIDRAVAQQALEALIENARLLGATQAKHGFGIYTDKDARFERACHESIYKHKTALRAALAEPEQDKRATVADLRDAMWLDPECANQGACQSLKFKCPVKPEQPMPFRGILPWGQNPPDNDGTWFSFRGTDSFMWLDGAWFQMPSAPVVPCPGRQAPVEPEQEPVAVVKYMETGGNAGIATRIFEIDDPLRERLRAGTLLYLAPTPRKPLTDEEIDRVTDQQWAQNNHKPIYAAHRAYARAVIAAYEAKNSATGEGA